MDAERWRHVEQILDAVLATERSQWSAVVEAHCRGDPELLQQVQALLARVGEAQSFLESSSAGIAAALLADLHEFEARRDEGRLIGAYRLSRELGCGGMSRVFLAERADGQYVQQVAIKLLRPGLDSDVDHSRIRAERQILATLNHPNIARLFDGLRSRCTTEWSCAYCTASATVRNSSRRCAIVSDAFRQ